MKPRTNPIWRIPIVLGAITAVCLVVALVDDGYWDLIASLGLGAVAVFGCYKGCVEKG